MLLRWIINTFLLLFVTDYVLCRDLRYKRSNDYVPCENGSYYYKDKCYKVALEKVSWDSAAKRCSEAGGHLVTISSKEDQDFVTSLIMLEVRDTVWIGLNDKDNETEYKWHDGSTYDYKNWQRNEPAGFEKDYEDCVQIVIDLWHDEIGQWNDQNCEWLYPHICQTKANPNKRSPNPRFCSSEAGGGFRFREDCYHLVTTMKSWEDAEKHCKEIYKGNLITILDNTVDFYLDYLLQNIQTELWMGIKIQDRFQQKWTSGWYVGYNGFKSEPRDFLENTCVIRTAWKNWTIVPCSKKYSFFCEVSTAIAPVLKPAIKGSYCPKFSEKWRDLDGEYCYFIGPNNVFNWYEANFDCMQRGGYLASIHSKEESDLLLPFIHYTQKAANIGLYKLLGQANMYAWADNSKTDYINFAPWEPNDEKDLCTEVRWFDFRLNDVSCWNRMPYICSAKKIVPNITAIGESDDQTVYSGGLTMNALIGVSVCINVLLISLGVIYCFRPCYVERIKNTSAVGLSPSLPAINRPNYRPADPRVKDEDCLYEEMGF